ncbi:MAG: hypothetical protein ACD_60C00026G0009 [uncultured bacterium]|nr:MAG: hypothetical protein ACD_60C00026G0009 [uncultured bacterium]
MPYITREDGERFVIPSYRDVLSAKKPALLKKEILLLSANYGEYITLQKKNADQYEAAFSPDTGYLLGESIWHYFKKPNDLIYCEAVPNTTEAILVIVKAGSVYLDGTFPVDSIADELVVFRTQQNHFEIYVHGDVPISEHPEDGKVSLDISSVKSFTILPDPVFAILPTLKTFQLRLVGAVLKAQGIGVIPVKKIALTVIALILIWMGFTYVSIHRKELPKVIVGIVNPYQYYINTLTSPSPDREIRGLTAKIKTLYTIPGWQPVTINYSSGGIAVNMLSQGVKTSVLYQWAAQNNAGVQVLSDGIYLSLTIPLINRPMPTTINPLQQVVAELIDRLSTVAPGNNVTLGQMLERGRFSEAQLTITFATLSGETLNLLADQLRGLPLVLSKVSITVDEGMLSGTIVLTALGN